MLLGNPDIEHAGRECRAEQVKPRARGHGCRNTDDPVICARFGDQGVGEHAGVARRIGGRLVLLTGDDVEFGDAVILVFRLFGRRIALALFGDGMNENRAVMVVADLGEQIDQKFDIMTVDRADMIPAQFLEHRAARNIASRMFHGAGDRIIETLAEIGRQLLAGLAHRGIGVAGDEPCKISRQGACGWCDRHIIVIENDDHAGIQRTTIVQRFKCHTGRHGPITDDRDDIVLAARKITRRRHAETG